VANSTCRLIGDRYVLQPTIATWGYTPPADGVQTPVGFSYRSNTNDLWYSLEDLRAMLASEV
jgi:UDP-N-acetylglucosamine 4,6-dehydratase